MPADPAALPRAQSNAPAPGDATRHVTRLTAPLLDGEIYLGDIEVEADLRTGSVDIPVHRLLALLAAAVDPATLDGLRGELAGQPFLRDGPLGSSGIRISYLPETVSVVADIPYRVRLTRQLSVAGIAQAAETGFEQPASTSAYINAVGTLHRTDPAGGSADIQGTVHLDGAVRIGGIVAESEATWQPGGRSPRFARRGSRLVYDAPEQALRLSAGDLRTIGTGFQATSAIAGVSLIRSFGILQPRKLIRPSGRGSFALERSSVVEVYVNDQLASRTELPPGNYDLRDLPYAQGTNEIRLVVRDDTGRQETLRFDQYFDLSQLSPGISEFAIHAGFHAPAEGLSPRYTGQWIVSGYYRRGMSDWLTLEGNLQADGHGAMLGAGGVLATSAGSFRLDVAASHHGADRSGTGKAGATGPDVAGSGVAGLLTFQRLLGGQLRSNSSVSFSIEGASRAFMPVGYGVRTAPYRWRATVDYLQAFGGELSVGVGYGKSVGWNRLDDSERYRATMNWNATPTLRVWADALHSRAMPGSTARETLVRVGLRALLGRRGTASLEHDTRNHATRLSYQTSRGTGAGAYNLFGELARSGSDTNVAFDGNYTANRALLGASHYSNLSGRGGSSSTLRFGSALAFADGALSIGPPIHDSFAIIQRHPALKDAQVDVDPLDTGYMATTGSLGSAVRGNLTSYVDRTITVQSPDAPPSADLGAGAFRIAPPYRSGYRLQVGSAYAISAVGTVLHADGSPLSLVIGQAREEGRDGDPVDGRTVDLFTNSAGRFGASGLRSGRWRLVFATATPTEYILDIPEQQAPVFDAGTLTPVGER